MIDRININGVTYSATALEAGAQATGITITVDGVTYLLGDVIAPMKEQAASTEVSGNIDKISVNGVVYDIRDVEDVAAERKRAMEAEAEIAEILSEGLRRETDARMSADNTTRSMGVLFGGFNKRQTTADEVLIGYKSIDQQHEGAFSIPAATPESAGVMTAEDKKKLNASIKNVEVSPNVGDVELDLEDNTGEITHVLFPEATTEKAGVMTAADKQKLDSLSPGGGDTMDVLLAEAEKRALRKLFIAAGAEYNDTDVNKAKTAPWGETVQHLPKHYYLNGLGDITEEQMLKIYDMRETLPMIRASATTERWFQGVKADYRTFFPIKDCSRRIEFTFIKNGYYAFNRCSAEVLKWTLDSGFNYYPAPLTGDSEGIFSNMQNLRFIDSLNASGGLKQDIFLNCPKLEYFRIVKLKNNLNFKDSPLLDKECVAYSINKAAPTSTITITLHPDAYARLANDADIVAALEAQPLITLVSA